MTIIVRYVLRLYLSLCGVGLFAFLGLYLVIDFFEKFDNLLHQRVLLSDSIAYFIFRIPFIVILGIPVSAILATIISLGILNRNREIIALKAAGISAVTYAGPILVMSVLLALGHFGIGESIARPFNHQAEEIWQNRVMRQSKPSGWSKENIWFRGKNLIYQIRVYDQRNQSLERVSISFLDDKFHLLRRLDAKRIRWTGTRWIAENGLVIQPYGSDHQITRFDELELDLVETPEDFKALETIPDEFNWLDLYSYINKLQNEGYSAVRYQVDWHLRLAFPITTVILVLFGLAIAMYLGHRGGIVVGVGLGIIAAGVLLIALQLGGSLGTAGILPPFFAAWTSNGLFGLLGIHLLRKAPQ
jgi:lipopolysaccharide export system permease protein